MIARLKTLVDRLRRQLHAETDAWAAERGFVAKRTGRFNLTQTYRDPRWAQRPTTSGTD